MVEHRASPPDSFSTQSRKPQCSRAETAWTPHLWGSGRPDLGLPAEDRGARLSAPGCRVVMSFSRPTTKAGVPREERRRSRAGRCEVRHRGGCPAAALHDGDALVTVGSASTPFRHNSQSEPAVAVDPSHPNVLVAGANDRSPPSPGCNPPPWRRTTSPGARRRRARTGRQGRQAAPARRPRARRRSRDRATGSAGLGGSCGRKSSSGCRRAEDGRQSTAIS
jgi:hypothetical protein